MDMLPSRFRFSMSSCDVLKHRNRQAEFREMAKSDLGDLLKEQTALEEEVKVLLIPKDPEDGKDVMLEIRGGTGGDEASIFAGDLYRMYTKFCEKKNWQMILLDESKNTHGGYRNVTFEIDAKKVFGELKNEAGVHRLVRMSPFNSKGLRHTSFAMVEVMPKVEKKALNIPDDELSIEFTRTGGPGGQNANRRDTAVRIVHLPTKISALVDSQRSQLQNREKAMEILLAKLYNRKEAQEKAEAEGRTLAKTTEIEWGNQIRSYVFHPYQMVKDHRTSYEVSQIDQVMDGDIDGFINAYLKAGDLNE